MRTITLFSRSFCKDAANLCLIAAALGTAVRLQAEMKWDATTIELAPTVSDVTEEAHFKFVNAGNDTVTIESVKPSCGCTIAELEKKTYSAGERGEVLARFEIGDRKGMQNVTIQVIAAGRREPFALSLIVKIPNPARIDPTALVWGKDEPTTPRTITVAAVEGQPLQVEKVSSSNAEFDARLEPSADDAGYRIVVTPKRTDRPMITLLNIDARVMGRQKVLQATAHVRANSSMSAIVSGTPALQPHPVAATLEPQLVAWKLGEAADPRTVSIRAPVNQRLRILKASSAAPNFQTKLEMIREGSEYRLTIIPLSADAASLAIVNIETADGPAEPPLRVYLQVRTP